MNETKNKDLDKVISNISDELNGLTKSEINHVLDRLNEVMDDTLIFTKNW